jgi:hypothetical protein
MSNAKIVKKPLSPRGSIAKKKKCIKNTFEFVQFKKMIGKGLITAYKNSAIDQNISIREKILSGSIKTIGISGFVSGGIVYIFDGVDRLLAIHSISYADIKKHRLDNIEIIVNQYSKMTPLDLI